MKNHHKNSTCKIDITNQHKNQHKKQHKKTNIKVNNKNLHQKLIKHKKDQAKEVERKSRKLKSNHVPNT